MEGTEKNEWFKVKIMFPVVTAPDGFTPDSEEEEEDPVLKRIRMKDAGIEEVETGFAYFNLATDPIMHLVPGSYLSKDAKKKRTYTLIVFESGNSVTAVGSSDDIYVQFVEFMKKD